MEPVLLVCGGCGVRIRTTDPAKARTKACPRCELSLGPAVDSALGIDLDRPAPADLGVPIAARPRSVRWAGSLLVVLIALGAAASFAVRGSSPGSSQSPDPGFTPKADPVPTTLLKAESKPAQSTAPPAPPDDEETTEPRPAVADLTPPPVSPGKDLAILDPVDRTTPPIPPLPAVPRREPVSIDQPPPPPVPTPKAEPGPISPGGPHRLLVRDKKGRAIVAREHGIIKDRLAVMLPDGQIGWPDGRVTTQEPFVAATMDEMRRTLLDDPEFAAFRLHQTAHYLILFQSKTDSFAKASGELLERLHDGLTAALRKNGLPIQPMEFPLVAVIFETEADFRANRQVPPDVQACYETLSNRIYFYEKSRRDQDAPEVSALRKPQTVAHEGTHQILHNVGIQPRMSDWPLWLVEGLAEYCSPPKFTKKGSVDWAGLGQVNSLHMATIRDLDDPLPNQFHGGARPPVVARDRGTPLVEYLVTRKELTPTDYALAWALTHYLAMKRTPEFVEYIKRMSQLKPGQEQSRQDQLATFREAFGADLAQMDGKVAKYLKNLKWPDVLPYYAVIFEQQVGTMIRRQAMVSQSPSMIRQWRESVTIPHGGEPRWDYFPHPNRKTAIEFVEQWMQQRN